MDQSGRFGEILAAGKKLRKEQSVALTNRRGWLLLAGKEKLGCGRWQIYGWGQNTEINY